MLQPRCSSSMGSRAGGSVLATLAADGAFVDTGYAEESSPSPRLAYFRLTFATGAQQKVILRRCAGGSPFGSVTISDATFDRFVAQPENLSSSS